MDFEQQTTRDLQVGDFVFVLNIDDYIEKYIVTKTESSQISIKHHKYKDKYTLIHPNDNWEIEGDDDSIKIIDYVSSVIISNPRLIDVVLYTRDKDWYFDWLTMNPNISFQDILNRPDLPWDISNVSRNLNVTMDDVRKHPDFEWDWNAFSNNKTITIDDLKHFSDKNWNWSEISRNSAITEHDIESTMNVLPWDFALVSANPNITADFVFRHPNKKWVLENFNNRALADIHHHHDQADIVFPSILTSSYNSSIGYAISFSSNPFVTIDDVIKNPRLWNWKALSNNEAISVDDIVKSSNLPFYGNWDWMEISARVRPDDVIKYPHLPWNDQVLSENSNMTLDFILKDLKSSNPRTWNNYGVSSNPGITITDIEVNLSSNDPFSWNWGYGGLSENPNVTPEFIEKHLDKNWNYGDLSKNLNVTPEFIEKHLDKNWNWDELSSNPNITIQFTLKHSDKDWDWTEIIKNARSEEIQYLIDVYDDYFKGDDDADMLSMNPNLTLDLIMKNSDFRWDNESLRRHLFGWSEQTLVKPSRR